MTQPTLNRRQMLAVAATSATGGLLARPGVARPASSGDRLRIAGIGVGGRGSADLAEAARFGDVVAVCDVDRNHAEGARQRHGGKADVYTDHRKLLERNDIDVVINGTPDHWHTAVCITACHLTNISLRLGRPLKWDPQSQDIPGDDEANAMQRRTQREPYTIPEEQT